MKKSVMKYRRLVSCLIILAVIVFSILVIKCKSSLTTEEEVAKCIGENAILYTQYGCHACKTQEGMFGENYKFLNVVDCFYDRESCNEVRGTPTWIINDVEHLGVQSIDKLKELTGC